MERKIQLFTDSHCDLTPKEAEDLGYHMILMPYSVDGVLYSPHTADYNSHDFYQLLRDGKDVKTHSISPYTYYEIFEPYAMQGIDCVYLALSRNMSSTVENCEIAFKQLRENFPNRRFELVDTRSITVGQNLILNYFSGVHAVHPNGDLDSKLRMLNSWLNRVQVLLFPENLKHFRRGGRVSNISAFFGDALSVRPLMCVNRQGELQIIKKVRGKQKIIKELVKMIEQNISKFTKTIYLAVSDNERLKLDLVEEIHSRIPDIIIECYDINPTTGAHCGPDTIGVGFMGKDSNLIF